MPSSRRSSPTRRLLTDSRVHFKSPENRPRPLVHYSDDVYDDKPRRPDYHRAASSDTLSPRPPSSADTDDDSDEYDWSGEDDLVDEEAKFDKNMGLNPDLSRRHRWGVRRSVPRHVRCSELTTTQYPSWPFFLSHRLHFTRWNACDGRCSCRHPMV